MGGLSRSSCSLFVSLLWRREREFGSSDVVQASEMLVVLQKLKNSTQHTFVIQFRCLELCGMIKIVGKVQVSTC